MQDVGKQRIVVLFGGPSGEYEVSLVSARSVLQALDRTVCDVAPVLIDRTGQWFPSRDGGDGPGSRAEKPLTNPIGFLRESADVVIPILHGTCGEDGTIQGLLEIAGVPYVGAGVLGSAVGMDKAMFKQVMQGHGIPIVPWRLVTASILESGPHDVVTRLELAFPYPMFTKPANLGSSVGICRCTNRDELLNGLAEARRYDRRLVVEQGIDARRGGTVRINSFWVPLANGRR